MTITDHPASLTIRLDGPADVEPAPGRGPRRHRAQALPDGPLTGARSPVDDAVATARYVMGAVMLARPMGTWVAKAVQERSHARS